MNRVDFSPSLCHYTALTQNMQNVIHTLTKACRAHDLVPLSYPLLPDEGAADHYLIMDRDQKALSALACVLLDPYTMECSAFTHPLHRKKGLFSRLLSAAVRDHEDLDILFPVCEDCPDTMAVISRLGAELSHREHRMELVLSEKDTVSSCRLNNNNRNTDYWRLLPPDDVMSENACWLFLPSGDAPSSPAGSCLTWPVSSSCLCLHHVEISPSLRGQGLGTRMLGQLLSHLRLNGISRIILQVSGDNSAALSLYKKTGFRITETLSYYLY